MRTLFAIAATLLLAACDGERLTGVAAQDAVRQHQASAVGDTPLILLDGRVIDEAEARTLDPSTIESVEVMKGVRAVKQYGERATRGAVLITSKSVSQ